MENLTARYHKGLRGKLHDAKIAVERNTLYLHANNERHIISMSPTEQLRLGMALVMQLPPVAIAADDDVQKLIKIIKTIEGDIKSVAQVAKGIMNDSENHPPSPN